jgi:PKD repeat protein
MFILGGVITPPTTGLLFQITFNIAARGFSQIHFLHALLSNGSPTPVSVGTSDGYFTNADCPPGSGVLCRPTVPSFTFSPSAPVPGQTVTFNASLSITPNRGAMIRTFFWDFGDGSTPTANPQDPANPVIQHAYLIPGNFTALLSITDSYGVTNSRARTVIVAPMKDFDISIPTAPGPISAGDSVTVTVSVTSLSGFSGLVNLTVHVNLLGPSKNPPTATLVQTSILLSLGGTNSTSIVVSTRHSTTRALYGLEVDATSGSLSHAVGVFLSVLHP